MPQFLIYMDTLNLTLLREYIGREGGLVVLLAQNLSFLLGKIYQHLKREFLNRKQLKSSLENQKVFS